MTTGTDRMTGSTAPTTVALAAATTRATIWTLTMVCISCLVMPLGLPYFDVSLVNVTVVKGQDVLLQCSIDHLGANLVAWLSPNSMALTLGEERVIDDARFSLVRTGSRHGTEEWNLHINEVRLSDSGQYRCSVNTEPVKFKVVALHVKVPPQITLVDDSDVIVMESDTLTISCNGTGIPPPEVTWRKVDDVTSGIPQQVKKGSNKILYLPSMTREHSGAYKCTADNGVPPPAVSYVRVKVQFAPKILLPLRRLGQNLGKEVLIDCTVRAYPMGETYWLDQSGKRVISSPEYFDESDDEVVIRLSITKMESSDFGIYRCCARNMAGSDCREMEIYEYKGESRTFPSPRLTTATTQTIPHHLRGRHSNYSDHNDHSDDYNDITGRHPQRPQLRPLLLSKTFWRPQPNDIGSKRSKAHRLGKSIYFPILIFYLVVIF